MNEPSKRFQHGFHCWGGENLTLDIPTAFSVPNRDYLLVYGRRQLPRLQLTRADAANTSCPLAEPLPPIRTEANRGFPSLLLQPPPT